ncbi:hypothetical protein VNI00_018176 [Paramarasmius palmivorus]|uniref:Xylanolytic transcriptional activator regulatory domain-containing protein n=1 Tax=Paramarasmius palmivorus TaxID=297713 RepID=A0AAW0AZY2_9AGAR
MLAANSKLLPISSTKTTVETLDDLVNRVGILEKAVSRLSRYVPPDVKFDLDENTTQDDVLPANVRASSMKPEGSAEITIVQEPPDEDLAMMLEDFALGHRIKRNRAAEELKSSPLAESLRLSSHGNPLTNFDMPFGEGHPLALLVDSSSDVVSRLVRNLPSEGHSRTLIQYYFDRIEWCMKIFHRPSFVVETNHLFRQIALLDGDSLSFGQISLPFLSTVFMVLCLSLHLIEPELCMTLRISIEEAARISKKMYSAAQACLWVDNFLARHSLESVQCLILMGTYQQNLDDSDSHWALLGSAIKIAQNLGISELAAESSSEVWRSPWNSVIKREVARRVWWNLVFSDWSNAAAHHGVYSIHPAQNHTALPSNVNDADIAEGFPLDASPPTQYTEMTYSLIRFRFVALYREIVDNRGRGYSFVLETDSRLREVIDSIPAHFDNKTGSETPSEKRTSFVPVDVTIMERQLSLIMGENRRMRLHRPFLFKGYTDPKYASLLFSHTSVDANSSPDQIPRPMHQISEVNTEISEVDTRKFRDIPEMVDSHVLWVRRFVLFIDLCHHKSDDPAAVEARRIELQEALNLFKRTQHVSAVSQNAVSLLEKMMQTARPRSSRKRSSPENDEPFERVVKRMLLDSNLSTGKSSTPQIQFPGQNSFNFQFPEQSSDTTKLGSLDVTGVITSPKLFQHPDSSLLSWSEQSYNATDTPASTSSSTMDTVTGSLTWNPVHKDPMEQAALFKDTGLFEPRAMKALENVTISELGQLLWGDDTYTLGDSGSSNLTWAPVLTA